MDQELEPLRWDGDRRFGVEAEINAFDGKSRPDDRHSPPDGIGEVGNLLVKKLDKPVSVTKWMATHNNNNYVVKPDGSCGMEVCTPVLKGWHGLKQVCEMVECFSEDKRIFSDERCSLHVHVNVADCTRLDVANIVAHWVKCEPVFLDSMPKRRKRSRYCQVVGMCDMFDVNDSMEPKLIIKKMGDCKYFTLNNYHYAAEDPSKRRDTVEFRVAENDACKDPFYAKNWTRLVVHFVERAKHADFPQRYIPGKPKTGLAWLDPIDVFEFLGFMPGQYNLSDGLKQTRNWFLARIAQNIFSGHELGGIWSVRGRDPAWREVTDIIRKVKEVDNVEINTSMLNPEDMKDALYSENYRI